MKYCFALASLLFALGLQSCTEACTCKRFCIHYDNDSVQLCRLFMQEGDFLHAADSLTALYGPGTDTIQPPPESLTAGSARADRFVRQWEQQEYYCLCAK